jgi:hypothetical protein
MDQPQREKNQARDMPEKLQAAGGLKPDNGQRAFPIFRESPLGLSGVCGTSVK